MLETSPRPLRLVALAALATAFAASALSPGEARAEVQVKVLEDGSKMIFNESQVERSRRRADHLVKIPQTELKRLIEIYARFFGLTPQVVQAVVQVESGYNVRALSSKGAMGLMQLMPGTADLLGVTDPYDPQQNIRGGTAYLRQQLDRFGSLALALAAYNAGPRAVERHGGIPPYAETQAYVAKVMSLFEGAPAPETYQITAADQAQVRRDVNLRREEIARTLAPPKSKIEVTRGKDNVLLLTNVPPERPSTPAAKPAPPRRTRPPASAPGGRP